MPTSIRVSTLLNSGISRNFELLLNYMGPYDHGQYSEKTKLERCQFRSLAEALHEMRSEK